MTNEVQLSSQISEVSTKIPIEPPIPERLAKEGVKGLLSFREIVWTVRKELAKAYLAEYGGNVTQAARAAGMHRNTFIRLVDRVEADGDRLDRKRSYRSRIAPRGTSLAGRTRRLG